MAQVLYCRTINYNKKNCNTQYKDLTDESFEAEKNELFSRNEFRASLHKGVTTSL